MVNLHSSPSDLWTVVKTAVQAGAMVTCATPKGVSRWGLPWYPAAFSSPRSVHLYLLSEAGIPNSHHRQGNELSETK